MAEPAPPPPLAAVGSGRRWEQLQRLRRQGEALEPWILALERGSLPAQADLLAALWARLDRAAVERLLRSTAALDPQPWLAAGLRELPALAGQAQVAEAWLEPLLLRARLAAPAAALPWLQLAGQFRHAAVARALRHQLQHPPAAASDQAPLAVLLPLLGRQRDPRDGPWLRQQALAPGPRRWRQAALEGIALGLAAWPAQPLAADLATLATDLDPTLAALAVDLLARLPRSAGPLRGLLRRPLAPDLRARVGRRLGLSPLVLVVHGRQGGLVPASLQQLAAELAASRGSPVLLQALTAAPPEPGADVLRSARRAGWLTLVPLLLLPGGHVRSDLPAIAAHWRGHGRLRRLPFLGAWPAWQQALAAELAALGAEPCCLHHPLDGPLAARYLRLLERRCGCRCLAAPYSAAEPADIALPPLSADAAAVLPLALAANRLCERLQAVIGPAAAAPLLERPRLRQALLRRLEALP